jgi:hypothetical protein
MTKRNNKKLAVSLTTLRPLDLRVAVHGGGALRPTSLAVGCICGPTAVTCQACQSFPTLYSCPPPSGICVAG